MEEEDFEAFKKNLQNRLPFVSFTSYLSSSTIKERDEIV